MDLQLNLRLRRSTVHEKRKKKKSVRVYVVDFHSNHSCKRFPHLFDIFIEFFPKVFRSYCYKVLNFWKIDSLSTICDLSIDVIILRAHTIIVSIAMIGFGLPSTITL